MKQANKISLSILAILPLCFSLSAQAQGQDSQTSERDFQVIESMLSGVYDNANQAYFDGRRGLKEVQRHSRLTVNVSRDEHAFIIELDDHDDDKKSVRYIANLSHDFEADRVNFNLSLKKKVDVNCDYVWRRGPEHFTAVQKGRCVSNFPISIELSEKYLWLEFQGDQGGGAYQLHRTRPFTCYADVPGVGGGRDIPYQRYEGFKLHDRGGSVWFDTSDNPPRKLGISLMLVDWPINNFKGAFARDSLVVYVSEQLGEERKEHGYGFTVPDADRIGINLKWILVNCYQVSPSDAVPKM